ncbi:hypothetical protein N8766_02955 [bacterium]|jgi:exopolyphosphatase / guanosine-5'-triphosphate,3'-diphosphate pyrophosphatase|nr:hypothetical protein [Verrucomicrobiota bacterium]MDA7633046.1 hypothetical protein [bacterium]
MIRRLGAIDIGSNTIKLLIADTDGQTVEPVCQQSIQTRLGSGIEKGSQLSQSAMERTRSTIFDYVAIGKQMSVESLIGNATSAVRDARNGQQFVQQLEKETGISISVITGEKEASLIFQGITSTQGHQSDCQVILDVGGGSTEIIVSGNQDIRHQQSFNVGSVRLLEEARLRDPLCQRQLESFKKLLATRYLDLTEAIIANTDATTPFRLMAAGGGAVLASMLLRETEQFDPKSIELTPLERTDLQALNERLWSTSLSARKGWPGMPEERADIVPIGTAILSHLLSSLNQDHLWVSTRGLRFGLLRQFYHETARQENPN